MPHQRNCIYDYFSSYLRIFLLRVLVCFIFIYIGVVLVAEADVAATQLDKLFPRPSSFVSSFIIKFMWSIPRLSLSMNKIIFVTPPPPDNFINSKSTGSCVPVPTVYTFLWVHSVKSLFSLPSPWIHFLWDTCNYTIIYFFLNNHYFLFKLRVIFLNPHLYKIDLSALDKHSNYDPE